MSLSSVVITPDVFNTCMTHALTSEKEEIMGLLLGDIMYDERGHATAQIWLAMPQIRTDRRKDRVEAGPEQLAEASSRAEAISEQTKRTTRVIGWYHSHPHITIHPSHVDVRTQAMYQNLDEGFVGLIFSAFNQASNKSQTFQVTAFQSVQPGWHSRDASLSQRGSGAHWGDDYDASIAAAISASKAEARAAALSQDQWIERHIPLSVLPLPGSDGIAAGLISLCQVLFKEEQLAYREAIAAATSSEGRIEPLTAVYLSAEYQQMLTRLIQIVVAPALQSVKNLRQQSEYQCEQLTKLRDILSFRPDRAHQSHPPHASEPGAGDPSATVPTMSFGQSFPQGQAWPAKSPEMRIDDLNSGAINESYQYGAGTGNQNEASSSGAQQGAQFSPQSSGWRGNSWPSNFAAEAEPSRANPLTASPLQFGERNVTPLELQQHQSESSPQQPVSQFGSSPSARDFTTGGILPVHGEPNEAAGRFEEWPQQSDWSLSNLQIGELGSRLSGRQAAVPPYVDPSGATPVAQSSNAIQQSTAHLGNQGQDPAGLESHAALDFLSQQEFPALGGASHSAFKSDGSRSCEVAGAPSPRVGGAWGRSSRPNIVDYSSQYYSPETQVGDWSEQEPPATSVAPIQSSGGKVQDLENSSASHAIEISSQQRHHQTTSEQQSSMLGLHDSSHSLPPSVMQRISSKSRPVLVPDTESWMRNLPERYQPVAPNDSSNGMQAKRMVETPNGNSKLVSQIRDSSAQNPQSSLRDSGGGGKGRFEWPAGKTDWDDSPKSLPDQHLYPGGKRLSASSQTSGRQTPQQDSVTQSRQSSFSSVRDAAGGFKSGTSASVETSPRFGRMSTSSSQKSLNGSTKVIGAKVNKRPEDAFSRLLLEEEMTKLRKQNPKP